MSDLADLISMASASTPGVAQGAQPIGYRQGLIKSWNPLTGENTVTVAGVDLVNLPVLSQGYGPVLAAGMPVAIAGVGSQMVILGRIAVPPTTTPFVQAFAGDFQELNPLTVPNSNYVTLITCSVSVPNWANSAMVVLSLNGSITNNSGVPGRSAFYLLQIDDQQSMESGQSFAAPDRAPLVSGMCRIAAATPGGTIAGRLRMGANGSFGSTAGSWAQLNMAVLFLAAGV